MNWTEFFDTHYPEFREENMEGRFLPYSKLKPLLEEKFPEKSHLGKSFLKRDIFLLKIGTGEKKVMAWSQMHGNESTGTRAMFDVINLLKSGHPFFENLLNQISLFYIPMLNPDGAEVYKRRNAVGIDLNRDFLKEASPEIKILKKAVHDIQPDYLFNLHDQRTIFNVGETPHPATLAFLAPAENKEREVTPTRIKAMSVISHIYKGMEKYLPNNISRFSDEFYPSSTGDNFTKMGFPAILFEAGHFPGDYARNEVRKYFAMAILWALEKIAEGNTADPGAYFSIPENDKKYLDIILRNVRLSSESSESLSDIGIYFEEKLNPGSGEVEHLCKIEEIGDLHRFHADTDVDLKGADYRGKDQPFPEVGESAHFSAGKFEFEKGRFKG